MSSWLPKSRTVNPIGIDLSEQKLRAVQLLGDGDSILAAAEWSLDCGNAVSDSMRTDMNPRRSTFEKPSFSGSTSAIGDGMSEAVTYFGGGKDSSTSMKTAETEYETAKLQSKASSTATADPEDDTADSIDHADEDLDLSIELGELKENREVECKPADPFENQEVVIEAFRKLAEDRRFRGRKVVLCLQGDDLFVQNARIPKRTYEGYDSSIYQEAEARLPASLDEMDLRFIEAGDIRQGNVVKSEVVLLAARKARIIWLIEAAEAAGLQPVAIDAEPTALLRSYGRLYRRTEDQGKSVMITRIGYRKTIVAITGEEGPLFVKHIDVGEVDFDRAVAEYLGISLGEAAQLRGHRGDRRSNRRDPDVARCLAEAVRPILDSLAHDLNMCVRYHSITFRRHPLAELVLTGPGVDEAILDWVSVHMNIPCVQGNPLRGLAGDRQTVGESRWDLAVGLAMRGIDGD